MPLKVGQPRDRQLVVSTHEMAVNELKDHGFPYAKVATGEDDGADGKQATLTFTAEPGKLAHFGPVEVVGNKSVDEHIIRRAADVQAGRSLSAQRRAGHAAAAVRHELFQFANVEPLNPEQQPDEVPTRVTVAEGNHQRVNFGVGYGTEEKARVDAEYHHVNFLGGARTAGAHARWSSLDRGVAARLQPAVFLRAALLARRRGAAVVHLHAGLQLGGRRRARLTLTHRQNEHTSWSRLDRRASTTAARLPTSVLQRSDAAQRSDRARPRSATGEQNGTLNALGVDFQHSTADNLLNAHRGYQIALHAEEAGRLLPGHVQLLLGVGRRPPLPAVRRQRSCSPAALQIGNIAAGRRRSGQRAVRRRSISSAARPASAAGAATKSAR